ncbi:hypothetical protein [Pseudomonas sp. NBRC 111134]|uniref:hypothetical protein n=1 Tax=Pseudomonas sp. NBRC 111134 TaxID=1661049 RepID=UPI000ADFB01D|nr:hypothetical protein [Pseudomonas sp. NBRC 111134]
MSYYFLIHRTSNLIANAFEAFEPEQPSSLYRLISVSDLVLGKYYATLAKHTEGTCVDAGEFALVSPSFKEAL